MRENLSGAQEHLPTEKPLVFEAHSYSGNHQAMRSYIQALAAQRLSLPADGMERARKESWGGFLANVDQVAPQVVGIEGRTVILKLRTKDGRTIPLSSETSKPEKPEVESASKQEKIAVLLEAAARYQAVGNALAGVEYEALRLAEGGVKDRIDSFVAAAEGVLYDKKPVGKRALQFITILGVAVSACAGPIATPTQIESTATVMPTAKPTETAVEVKPTAAPKAPIAPTVRPEDATPAELPASGKPAEKGTVTAVESEYPMAAGLEMRAESHGVPMKIIVGMTTNFAVDDNFETVTKVRQDADKAFADMVLERLYYGGWLPRNPGTKVTFEQWAAMVKAGDSNAGFNLPAAVDVHEGRPKYNLAARWEPAKNGGMNGVELVLDTAQRSKRINDQGATVDFYITGGILVIVSNWPANRSMYDLNDPNRANVMDYGMNITLFEKIGYLEIENEAIIAGLNMARMRYPGTRFDDSSTRWATSMLKSGSVKAPDPSQMSPYIRFR